MKRRGKRTDSVDKTYMNYRQEKRCPLPSVLVTDERDHDVEGDAMREMFGQDYWLLDPDIGNK